MAFPSLHKNHDKSGRYLCPFKNSIPPTPLCIFIFFVGFISCQGFLDQEYDTGDSNEVVAVSKPSQNNEVELELESKDDLASQNASQSFIQDFIAKLYSQIDKTLANFHNFEHSLNRKTRALDIEFEIKKINLYAIEGDDSPIIEIIPSEPSQLKAEQALRPFFKSYEGTEALGLIEFSYSSAVFKIEIEYDYSFSNDFRSQYKLMVELPVTFIEDLKLYFNDQTRIKHLTGIHDQNVKAHIIKHFNEIFGKESFVRALPKSEMQFSELIPNLPGNLSDFNMALAESFGKFCKVQLLQDPWPGKTSKLCSFSPNQEYHSVSSAQRKLSDIGLSFAINPIWIDGCLQENQDYNFLINLNGNSGHVMEHNSEIYMYSAKCYSQQFEKNQFYTHDRILNEPVKLKFIVSKGVRNIVAKISTGGRNSQELSQLCKALEQHNDGSKAGYIFMPTDQGEQFSPPAGYWKTCEHP